MPFLQSHLFDGSIARIKGYTHSVMTMASSTIIGMLQKCLIPIYIRDKWPLWSVTPSVITLSSANHYTVENCKTRWLSMWKLNLMQLVIYVDVVSTVVGDISCIINFYLMQKSDVI